MDDFKLDLFRYYGEKGESFKDRFFRKPEIKYLYYLRKAQNTKGLLQLYYRYRLHRQSLLTQIQIPYTCKLGPGFNIGHFGMLIINPKATIGKNVTVSPGTIIGQENRGKRIGAPTIGDSVWIGANVAIVGQIKIGNDVLIAPNSYVNEDVPDHSVVMGNPCVIHHKDKATEGYLSNLV